MATHDSSQTSQLTARQQLRSQLRSKRRALSPAQQKLAAMRLLKQAIKLPSVRKAKHLAIYLPNDGEIDPQQLIRWCWQQRKSVYLPVLHPIRHNSLWFVRYTQHSAMIKNKFGIQEPASPYRPIRSAQSLDLVLLPLVGFDSEGGRLGMGGGYYDRTFSFLKKYKIGKPGLIGLAHELQRVEKLPIASWDVPLTAVMTDQRLYTAR